MKSFLIGFIGTAVAFVLFMAVAIGLADGQGIVVLEDYAEGVAFCEEEFSTVVHVSDATVWNDGKATFVVNPGHEKDPEVKELVKLAHSQCAQFHKE